MTFCFQQMQPVHCTPSHLRPTLSHRTFWSQSIQVLLGIWRRRGVVNNISSSLYKVECSRLHLSLGDFLLPTHFNCISEQGVRGLEGAHKPTCSATSTLSLEVLRGRRGAWVPCISVYLVYRVLCHLVQYACSIVLPLISGL